MKAGPIALGSYTDSSHWLQTVYPIIQERVASYSATENSFNLLLMRESLIPQLQEKVAMIDNYILTTPSNPNQHILEELRASYKQRLQDCLYKKESDKQESIKRRHNYIPFIVQLLRELKQR